MDAQMTQPSLKSKRRLHATGEQRHTQSQRPIREAWSLIICPTLSPVSSTSRSPTTTSVFLTSTVSFPRMTLISIVSLTAFSFLNCKSF